MFEVVSVVSHEYTYDLHIAENMAGVVKVVGILDSICYLVFISR